MEKVKSFESFFETEITNESKDVVSTIEADQFISDVLKMGSRDNLFDKFIKKEKINPDELSMLVSLVADRLKEKWS